MRDPLPTVYLAGPDLFHRDRTERYEALRQVCLTAGLRVISPLDCGTLPTDRPARIRARNLANLRRSNAVLANLSGFRGPEPDSGTVYEVGYAAALGHPVVCYMHDHLTLRERVGAHTGLHVADATGTLRDRNGIEVEDYELRANLMLAAGHLIFPYAFEAVIKLAELLHERSHGPERLHAV